MAIPVRNIMDILKPGEDVNLQQVLLTLLDGKNDIDIKSEIHAPRNITILTVIRDYFEEKGMKKCANTLSVFIKYYCRYMISHDRQSRKEIVEAFKSLREQQDRERNENPQTKVI